mmetsp:Transcript_59527/g.70931  ORF Transcript_59527/g.70931 Transcript_59527/m.70931 type:complete len:125 (-) Transcript_59527:340-714(-)
MTIPPPSVLLLKWIDPPFDAGHWIPKIISVSGCWVAPPHIAAAGRRSKEVTWKDVYDCDPDVVLVACCGFNLTWNVSNARACAGRLPALRPFYTRRVYDVNENEYFARPGPTLVGGVGVLMWCG